MNQTSGFRFFKKDLCDECGICLERCPVLELPEGQAKLEIKALINGDTGFSLVLENCVTCNACDFICPQKANPYGLILERYDGRGRRRSLPYIAKFIFPNEPENMWTSTRVLMEKEELSLVTSWEENLKKPRKEVLLTGFYNNLIPYISEASLLDDLRQSIAGSDCMFGIGEDAYRIGFLDEAERLGRLAKEKFTSMGIEKMYCFMVVEACMFTDILPKKFGIDFDFEVDLLDNWILDRLKSGRIPVTNPLKMKVSVHDNCCGRYLDGVLQETTREIAERTGCILVEMPHNRENALCCGWAGTVPTLLGPTSGNPFHTLLNLLQSLYLRLQEAEETGAEVMVVPCPGCCAFLSVIKELTNSRVDIYLPIELAQLASGEKPVHRHGERAWDILAVTTSLMLRWPFARKRFVPRPVDIKGPLPQASTGHRLGIKFFGRLYHSVLVQNRATRALIAFSVKALIKKYRRYLEKQKVRLKVKNQPA